MNLVFHPDAFKVWCDVRGCWRRQFGCGPVEAIGRDPSLESQYACVLAAVEFRWDVLVGVVSWDAFMCRMAA